MTTKPDRKETLDRLDAEIEKGELAITLSGSMLQASRLKGVKSILQLLTDCRTLLADTPAVSVDDGKKYCGMRGRYGWQSDPCGKPVVPGTLFCEKHLATRTGDEQEDSNSELQAKMVQVNRLYQELIYEVINKVPGQTRHERAKQIIHNHENQNHEPEQAAKENSDVQY